jgi:hypothetical protein
MEEVMKVGFYRFFSVVSLISLVIMAGCAAPVSATQPQLSTSTPGALQAAPDITLADNNSTISLKVGQSFLLKLGEGFDWNVSVTDQNIISRVINILVVRGAQGVYQAHQAGQTILTAVGDPTCRTSTPPCAAPSMQFKVQLVVVRP